VSYWFYQERDGSVTTAPKSDGYYIPFETEEVATHYGIVISRVWGGLYCVLDQGGYEEWQRRIRMRQPTAPTA
jgi:hypothetical protein